ncbi:MAG TPA: YajQ family cyclic di-GMP-binding protein [Candidatus Saccharibacteria bacterium]|nr:YajQ family cyclic di-GMP-binding protein [Candidatus Saccharibacteria bacterium]MCB9817303.1 YajQ family cyclic di-GMP-binding protein [Candidatus Nomurabacteria bacterium]HPD99377.1 YajQ family cyclic di-GMP-binding protein [Candidatus Saccharibacteria bacterium]HPR10618.1 YajQ family cyclic di-GMP-binding protein [Candidatus Saccharibacteria bacterium]
MALFSFDLESEYDKSEMNNVVDQAQREIANRYDFKNTTAQLSWKNDDKQALLINGDTQFQLDAIIEIIRKKLALRGQSQKCLDVSAEPTTNNLRMSLTVPLVRGLDQAKAKAITSLVREHYPKVKTQIQGETVRIMSAKKDELQNVITLLKTHEFDFPIIFTNYR